MSAYMREHAPQGGFKGHDLYKVIQGNKDKIHRIFEIDENEPGKRHVVRPACVQCGKGPGMEENMGFSDEHIASNWRTQGCPADGIFVSPGVGQNNWSMHYTVDPLRDLLLSKYNAARILHVFGGDYGVPWGRRGTSKAERLSVLLPWIDKTARVDHFVGPLLQRYGKKLAKSNGDASGPLSVAEIQALLKSDSAVIDMTPPRKIPVAAS